MNITYRASVLGNVDKAIADAIASVGTMKKKVQIACVSILQHAVEHGDYSKAGTLIEGCTGVNQTAIVEWFRVYGGLEVTDGEGFTGWQGADYIRERFQEAKKVMWFDLKKQSPYKGFNNIQAVMAVLNSTEKARKTAQSDAEKAEKIVIDEQFHLALRGLIELYTNTIEDADEEAA